MSQRGRRLAGLVRSSVPEGTLAVGVGLAVAALTSYVFVIVSLNALTGGAKAAFSAYWGVIFVAGPGFFLPIEQEIGRALSRRRAQGVGGGPLVARAARVGALITVVLVVASLLAAPLLNRVLYHGDLLFAVALALGLVSFFCIHMTRGILAGEGRFQAYGRLLAFEGGFRLLAAIGLSTLGVERGGAYAMIIAVAPFVAVALVSPSLRGVRRPGPSAPYSEISSALGWLLGGSVFMQALGYAPLIGINVLATSSEKEIAAGFASAFFVARVPILAFQAIQGTLLPKLAGLRGAGKHDEFAQGFRKLLLLVVGVAVVGAVAGFTIGPAIGRMLFADFTVTASILGLLVVGSGCFIIALTYAQALLALDGQRPVALAWLLGLVASLVVTAVVPGLELRVVLGLVVGASVTTAVMALLVARSLKGTAGLGIEPLIEAIEHEPIEI